MKNEQTKLLKFKNVDIDYEKIREDVTKDLIEKGFADFNVIESAIKEKILEEYLNQRPEILKLYQDGEITFRD